MSYFDIDKSNSEQIFDKHVAEAAYKSLSTYRIDNDSKKFIEILEKWIQAGAKANMMVTQSNGKTTFANAVLSIAYRGSISWGKNTTKTIEKMIELLSSSSDNFNQKDENGYTPLLTFCASSWTHTDYHTNEEKSSLNATQAKKIISLFLAKGSSLDERNADDKGPLAIANENKNNAVLDALQSMALKDEKPKFTDISSIVNNSTSETIDNDIKILKKAKKLGFDFNFVPDEGNPLLHLAVGKEKSQYDLIKTLIDCGCDLNLKNSGREDSPLFLSTDPEISSLLIESGADVNFQNKNGDTALMQEISSSHSAQDSAKIIKPLLKSYNINTQNNSGETALMIASEKGFFQIAKSLVTKGADVNLTNEENQNALSYVFCQLTRYNSAAEKDKLNRIGQLLLEKGISTNVISKSNFKSGSDLPLITQATQEIEDIGSSLVKEIIKRTKNIQKNAKTNKSPLKLLLKTKNYKLAQLAIDKGTPINNPEGYDQPLTGTVVYGWERNELGAKRLLELGANPLIKDHEDKTYLERCIKCENDSSYSINYDKEDRVSIPQLVDYIIEKYDVDPEMKTSDGERIIDLLKTDEVFDECYKKLENKLLQKTVSNHKFKNKQRINL